MMSAKDFKHIAIASEKKYRGDKKVLVLCSSESQLTMSNGKVFSTGHNPSEIFVPLIHLKEAGFECDFATESGQPVAYEKWAIPGRPYAKILEATIEACASKLSKPLKLADLPDDVSGTYIAVFMPGGHNVMHDMHKSRKLGALLRVCHQKQLTTAFICHAVNNLRSAQEAGHPFIYDGYTMTGFPDKDDKEAVGFGYLPGQMTEFQWEELMKLGPTIKNANNKAGTAVHVDRELVSGQSQHAAHYFGVKLVDVLLSRAPDGIAMARE